MSPATTLVITAAQAGRIDRALAAAFPQVGRRRLAELFATGAVRVGGKVAKKGDRVLAGAVVELAVAPIGRGEERPLPDPAAAARLRVLLERPDLVAVAKPAAMASQPLRAGELGSAASGLAHLYPECAVLGDDPRDGGVVHRLDIGTTGVLLAARTAAAYRQLREAFSAEQVTKTYLAISCGRPVASACSSSLGQRGRRAVVDEEEGLSAHTDVEVLAPRSRAAAGGGAAVAHDAAALREAMARDVAVSDVAASRDAAVSDVAASRDAAVSDVAASLDVMARDPAALDLCLVRCTARTGRMHQVRAHLALLRAPILGDALYGAPPVAATSALAALVPPERFFLHAESITVTLGKETLTIKAPIPEEMQAILTAAGLDPK
jgi:23S rRNA pseudouridine1911/1915/1917 synthase